MISVLVSTLSGVVALALLCSNCSKGKRKMTHWYEKYTFQLTLLVVWLTDCFFFFRLVGGGLGEELQQSEKSRRKYLTVFAIISHYFVRWQTNNSTPVIWSCIIREKWKHIRNGDQIWDIKWIKQNKRHSTAKGKFVSAVDDCILRRKWIP